ncbi:hypothetical protein [Spiroplasma turonicum]|uniref:Uncharacterized protein n=1 Tax=Spiroplasma turonicum TaxID=216946 RepID=A0A0K1P756_9MOLU|nr:hypothetical protein [Spiroplasma turonicum]AKU79727.1 hypothetical protein STURON_00481 [Spiroplasma turonicum]ALX70745.1 hypothetical protein STURO_v1c04790 [Spiroplasma turonicum]
MEHKIADRNYFLEKLQKDKEINNILEGLTNQEKKDALKDIQEIRKILHLKEAVDKQIIKEYSDHIIVPTGTEDTLIRELNIFNKQMYSDYPTFYTLDFDDLEKKDEKELKTIIKPQSIIQEKTFKKNILNLSQPHIQESTQDFSNLSEDIIDIKNDNVIQDANEEKNELFETFKNFETVLSNNPVKIKVEHFDNLLVDYKTEGKELLNNQSDLVVNSEDEKRIVISSIKESLENGNYHKLNLKKSFSLSYSKYMQRLKNLKKNIIKTYGSEIFTRIKNVIQEENALYSNIDRSNKIKQLNLKKFKYKKRKTKF